MRRTALSILAVFTALIPAAAGTPPYDPLAVPASAAPAQVDLDVIDANRDRTIPVRVYLPAGDAAAPVILLSHGLGGSREGGAYLGAHWAARGFVCVAMQHPGSDTSVWRGEAPGKRLEAMERAANGKNFRLRVQDVPAVLDQLARWNSEAGHPLAGRLDLDKVGMAGHSFGAVTTQAVSGQRYPLGWSATDPRIDAALALSPSAPRRGDADRAFGGVGIPWMLMTGTRDTSLIGGADVASRLAVYPALPPGSKYELVLFDAEHSAFSDRALPGDKAPRNPNHHRAIRALSTAFWDAYLTGNPQARAWLDGPDAQTVLEPRDRWQRK